MRLRIISLCIFLIFVGIVFLSLSDTEASGAKIINIESPRIRMAYVECQRPTIPQADLFTHLIYSFGYFNDSNDGVIVTNPDKLRKMSLLKNANPDLKIILGIGSMRREGFSEMACDEKKRISFAKSCVSIIVNYNLDGIDLDWEFPGTEKGGLTARNDDAYNYGLVVKELRRVLGKNKSISFYSNNSGKWIDFDEMLPFVDFVNVSGYNLSVPQKEKDLNHQSPLYPSEIFGTWCIDKSVKKHMELGVPSEKIVLGIPFFGRGKKPFPGYIECNRFQKFSDSAVLCWDKAALVPYYIDNNKKLVLSFDDEQSIKYKCEYIKSKGLAGAFIWNYDSDYSDHKLAKSLRNGMNSESVLE